MLIVRLLSAKVFDPKKVMEAEHLQSTVNSIVF